ncbi:MAG: hypothetical protein H7175_18070 [Burkholderiales bacterium]|nr:hypothetical protein [Anaerolineae bacterium]
MKTRRLWLIAVGIVSLSFGVVAAQETPPVVSAALQGQMDQIESTTSTIRGLDSTDPIERDFPTRADLREYVNTVLDEEMNPELAARLLLFYAAFDLLPPDADLRELYETLLNAQIAGFYDIDTRIMNVVLFSGDTPGDQLPVMEQIIYSHEYVHALQDMHFGLETLGLTSEQSINEPDRTMALQALIEGDATQVMNQYAIVATQDNPMAVFSILGSALQSGGLFLPQGTPPVIANELMYPYLAGAEFVAALYGRGGWAAVDGAYVDLPQSTEQILHPDRYFAGDEPIAVTLRPDDTDYTAALGEGWSLVWDRTMGEFYLREYLDTQLAGRSARMAAEGWGGDRYLIFHNEETGGLAWVVRFVWDTPEDAAEFAEAFAEFGNTRFEAEKTELSDDCWTSDAEALCIVDEGENGHLLAFAPSQAAAQALMVAQQ